MAEGLYNIGGLEMRLFSVFQSFTDIGPVNRRGASWAQEFIIPGTEPALEVDASDRALQLRTVRTLKINPEIRYSC